MQKSDYNSLVCNIGLDYSRKNPMCRTQPQPRELDQVSAHQKGNNRLRDNASCLARNGPLKDWTVVPSLPDITAPTLIYNGARDTSRDTTPSGWEVKAEVKEEAASSFTLPYVNSAAAEAYGRKWALQWASVVASSAHQRHELW
ncbi:Peptidase S33- tricorn interacting factor 1 [Apiospora marii]|uniref:Peptidase S33- tricorn interacting factor 1 n=1 Tax=Apiospora marii TaxID=335849 RepID=A0ABR1R993_9PEZI